MPVYTYKCKKCTHIFDINQRMSDDPITDCPACQGSVKKVINNVGIVFKGSGFYVTDNKSKSNGRSSTTESTTTASKSESTSSSNKESSSSAKATKD